MINKNIKASKYASAVFNSFGDDERVLKELSEKVALLSHESIRSFFTNPKVEKRDKIKLLSKDITILKEFVKLISKMGDILLLPLVEEHLLNFIYKSRGIIRSVVHVTSRFSDEDIEKLRIFLEKSLDKKIELTKVIDNSLIGGIKIEIAGKVIDYSFKNDLKRMSDLKVK